MLMQVLFFLVFLPAFGLIMSHAQSAKARSEREQYKSYAGRRAKIAQPKPQPVKAKPAETPKRKRGRPRKNPQSPQETQRPRVILEKPSNAPKPVKNPAAQEIPVAQPAPIRRIATFEPVGNNAFAGEVVAFTGTLPGMTRSEAIEAVRKNGGKAFESMPVTTTILVVGDKPGRNKLDKVATMPNCRIMDAREFRVMLMQDLIMEPEEFEIYFMTHIIHKEA